MTKNDKRCLWIHQNFVTAHQTGNSRPTHLISALLDQGWCVDVVTGTSGYLDQEASGKPEEREGKLSIYRVDTSGKSAQYNNRKSVYLRFNLKAFNKVNNLPSANLIYASSPPMPQLLLCILASIRNKASLLLEIRDIHPAYIIHTGQLKNPGLIWFFQWVEALAYRYADHCIIVNPTYIPYVQGMGLSLSRISVVPTGGHPETIASPREQGIIWREKHQLTGRFIMLYAGSFNEYYGLRELLKAATAAPEICWVFAGNGRDRELIEAAAEKYTHIKYIGSLPKNELAPVFAATDVGIVTHNALPLLETALSGKVFDYLAAGLPILSLTKGISGEVVSVAEAGITLCHPNAEEIREASREFQKMSADDRNRMGRNGKEWLTKYMHAADMGGIIADIAATFPLKISRTVLLARFAKAAVLALHDVLFQHSSKLIKLLYLNEHNRKAIIRDTLQKWLSERNKNSH